MDDDGLKSTLRSMREDWDRRARENARHYVATQQAAWTDEEFFASGEKEVADEILSDMANICQERQPASMRVLEIGCGAGRVTRALARLFGEVHAVDVSGEMVAQARAALSGQANAFVYQNNGMDLSVVPGLPFDFAFSVIVFQHIPSRDVIESYFREVARLLRPGALFKVQVLGCPPVPKPAPAPAEIPRPLWKRLLRRILRPAPVPPESPFDPPNTWVGFMLTSGDAQALCDQCGFELRHQRGAGEQEYWLWCFKK
jgi:SAM-dependent methyltransferase